MGLGPMDPHASPPSPRGLTAASRGHTAAPRAHTVLGGWGASAEAYGGTAGVRALRSAL